PISVSKSQSPQRIRIAGIQGEYSLRGGYVSRRSRKHGPACSRIGVSRQSEAGRYCHRLNSERSLASLSLQIRRVRARALFHVGLPGKLERLYRPGFYMCEYAVEVASDWHRSDRRRT